MVQCREEEREYIMGKTRRERAEEILEIIKIIRPELFCLFLIFNESRMKRPKR